MPDVSFGNLLVVAVVAVLAPLAIGFFPRLRIPAVVLEIVGGIVIGPSSRTSLPSSCCRSSSPRPAGALERE